MLKTNMNELEVRCDEMAVELDGFSDKIMNGTLNAEEGKQFDNLTRGVSELCKQFSPENLWNKSEAISQEIVQLVKKSKAEGLTEEENSHLQKLYYELDDVDNMLERTRGMIF